MSTAERLTEVYGKSREIAFDNHSKFIFFSDCHRGNGSWADNFASNRNLFNHALEYYYARGFTYIEVGDGDELWENRSMSEIIQTHEDTFRIMHKFYQDGRLYMIFGNHDASKSGPKYRNSRFYRYYSYRSEKYETLFSNPEVHEGLVLKHTPTNREILVVHGHQGDLINDRLWRLARFLVRYVWNPLEMIGIKNPTSPAKNHTRKGAVERNISNWVKANKKMIITGHTHRPMFPKADDAPYFNAGCCVHPNFITGIEIQKGEISLICWSITTNSEGMLQVTRKIIAGPEKLEKFLG